MWSSFFPSLFFVLFMSPSNAFPSAGLSRSVCHGRSRGSRRHCSVAGLLIAFPGTILESHSAILHVTHFYERIFKVERVIAAKRRRMLRFRDNSNVQCGGAVGARLDRCICSLYFKNQVQRILLFQNQASVLVHCFMTFLVFSLMRTTLMTDGPSKSPHRHRVDCLQAWIYRALICFLSLLSCALSFLFLPHASSAASIGGRSSSPPQGRISMRLCLMLFVEEDNCAPQLPSLINTCRFSFCQEFPAPDGSGLFS